MEIGNNENVIDEIDEMDDSEFLNNEESQNLDQEKNVQEENSQDNQEDLSEDFISSLLRSRGIEDKTKIKFENEDGEIEELDWNNLNDKDKFNILSSSENSNNELDDDEIELINAIRNSNLSASEYLLNLENSSIQRYIQNSLIDQYNYSVDQYTDDELFVMDFIARTEDATDEEVEEALQNAKSNEALFKKLVGAIREEYKTIERENIELLQIELQAQEQEQYNQFSESVANQIGNFTNFSGYDLNMDNEDMQQLYEFITGVDTAGNNHFAKALSDPEILVKTAWFALNGEQMINDITDYYNKEITKVRKESYKKGLEDFKNKNNVVYKSKSKNNDYFDDLD